MGLVHEYHKQGIVRVRIGLDIKDGQKDQAQSANDGGDDGANAESRLSLGVVGSQAVPVSKPAFGDEGKVEYNDHGGAPRDEERSEEGGADIRNVCDVLVGRHEGIVRRSGCQPVSQHSCKSACDDDEWADATWEWECLLLTEPYCAGEQWQEPVRNTKHGRNSCGGSERVV